MSTEDSCDVYALPEDYRDIISRSVEGAESLLEKFPCEEDLYRYLNESSILIDEGLKSFWLKRGKKCYMLASRALNISWGGTTEYWQFVSLPESRFAENIQLLDVAWLDIQGKIDISMLTPDTKYAAYLVYSPKSILSGFATVPTEGSVFMTGEEDEDKKSITISCLDPPEEVFPFKLRTDVKVPQQRDDGCFEVELGEFFVNGDEDGDLEMNCREVKVQNWKRGLIIEGIEIRLN